MIKKKENVGGCHAAVPQCPFCQGQSRMGKAGMTACRVYWAQCLNRSCMATGPTRETEERAAAEWGSLIKKRRNRAK